jgi:hypothetical protein
MTKTAAEQRLAELEAPRHARERAWHDLKEAEKTGESSKISAAAELFSKALQAEQSAGVSDRDIGRAAHDVHMERGERHTETNILKPGKAQFSDADRAEMLKLDEAVKATTPGTGERETAEKNYLAVVGRKWIDGGH